MRVAFVHIDPAYRDMGPFHVGIASLIAYLRREGHQCHFFHLMGDVKEEAYVDFLKRNDPDVVAFSIMTNIFPHVAPLAELTRAHSRAFTMCGGVHATLSPEETIAIEAVDALCIGEGEDALLELCRGLERGEDISAIPNLWVKRDGAIHRNPVRPLIEDLDTLPFMDREVFPYEESFDLKFMRRGVFMASRGCPFSCTYCCSQAMKRLYGGNRYIRFRSVTHMIEEVEQVVKGFPQIEYTVFHDDLLPMKKQWFEEFTRAYRQRIGLPFEMNCHVNLMDRDIAVMAKEAGCSLMRFGLESGNDYIRRTVLGRRTSRERIVQSFDLCHEMGIKTLSYNMIGLPFETQPQVMDTVKLNAQVQPKVVHVSIFYPFPGTEAYDLCTREGFITDKHIDTYYEDSVLKQESISSEQLKALRHRFEPLVKLYGRLYRMPRVVGWPLERLVDLWVRVTTGRRWLRLLRRRRTAGDGHRPDAGPCYTLHQGDVNVWSG